MLWRPLRRLRKEAKAPRNAESTPTDESERESEPEDGETGEASLQGQVTYGGLVLALGGAYSLLVADGARRRLKAQEAHHDADAATAHSPLEAHGTGL